VTVGASTSAAAAAPSALESSSHASGSSSAAAATTKPKKPKCAGTYTVIANDYWNRFPKSSGASVAQWLTANNATASTPLYVGDKLCVPAGAKAPAAPPATTPSTTATTAAPAPTTTKPAVVAAVAPKPRVTTAAPVTTKPPAPVTTAAPAPPAPPAPPVTTAAPAVSPQDNSSPAAVEAMIREIWPDDIEDRALTIAKRESHLDPSVHNYCCYGVFAIYFDMGKNFLPQMGITSPQQLLDARTNILAAYKLYTIAGWKPWAQTDPGA